MTGTKEALILTMSSMLILMIPAGAAQSDDGSGGNCNGEIEVQTNPLHNRYYCDSCQGSIVVQVGTNNEIDCDDGCHGNLFVQVGTTNWLECVGSLAGRSAAVTPAQGVCPRPLPEDNFYCHVLGRILPQEFCLTFDFCIW